MGKIKSGEGGHRCCFFFDIYVTCLSMYYVCKEIKEKKSKLSWCVLAYISIFWSIYACIDTSFSVYYFFYVTILKTAILNNCNCFHIHITPQ